MQGADPTLSDRIRPWYPGRCADDPDIGAGEHGVEGDGERAVSVADQEPKLVTRSPRSISRLRACCMTRRPGRHGRRSCARGARPEEPHVGERGGEERPVRPVGAVPVPPSHHRPGHGHDGDALLPVEPHAEHVLGVGRAVGVAPARQRQCLEATNVVDAHGHGVSALVEGHLGGGSAVVARSPPDPRGEGRLRQDERFPSQPSGRGSGSGPAADTTGISPAHRHRIRPRRRDVAVEAEDGQGPK